MIQPKDRRNRSAYRSDYYRIGMSPRKGYERPERAAHMQDNEPIAEVHYAAAVPIITCNEIGAVKPWAGGAPAMSGTVAVTRRNTV